ncbi:MAG: hypothetical protein WBX03_10395 [Terriglobales bacterium]|jgi:hypothetical protein
MTQLGRRLIVIAAVVVGIPVALWVAVALFFAASAVPSNIVDFSPTSFQTIADTKFFYSISNELKYSDQIDSQVPTLMRGKVWNFLVSPDNKMIAVVANGQLAVVSESLVRQITPVDSIYTEPKPIGRQFFRDDDFQWSKDSKVLYLIRDEYYESRGSQLFSSKGELWKYDIESASLQLVLKPFRAFSYFIGLRSGIYFSTPTDRGDLQLQYSDGNSVTDIDVPNAKDIRPQDLARDFAESPFYSFSLVDYEKAMNSVRLVADGSGGPQKLVIGGRSYLALTQGKGFKGPHYCSDMVRSVFLPGNRYYLFNVPYCGNYSGQLLIDTVTGMYQRLPADSVVYITLNTGTLPSYRITGGGIVVR